MQQLTVPYYVKLARQGHTCPMKSRVPRSAASKAAPTISKDGQAYLCPKVRLSSSAPASGLAAPRQ
jgi:hypothetical protein